MLSFSACKPLEKIPKPSPKQYIDMKIVTCLMTSILYFRLVMPPPS